jgi:hypothetical protein
MKNLLTGSTALFVLLLFIGGIYYPNTLEMRLADTSLFYTLIRAVMIALLVTVLVTNPPRSPKLRSIIGVWAIVLAAFSSSILFSYNIEFLDALVFMQVAIILGIEALEVGPVRVSETRRIPVRFAPPAPRKINVTTA